MLPLLTVMVSVYFITSVQQPIRFASVRVLLPEALVAFSATV